MTELEKMVAGVLYRADDPGLVAMRAKAREWFTVYNQTTNTDRDHRQNMLKTQLGATGKGIDIQPPFYCDYGTHIYIGENVFINYNCTILDCGRVRIGDNVFIGPNVSFYTAYHPLMASERIKGPELASPITVGDNVWLGGNVILCQGVDIGKNTTIDASTTSTANWHGPASPGMAYGWNTKSKSPMVISTPSFAITIGCGRNASRWSCTLTTKRGINSSSTSPVNDSHWLMKQRGKSSPWSSS